MREIRRPSYANEIRLRRSADFGNLARLCVAVVGLAAVEPFALVLKKLPAGAFASV